MQSLGTGARVVNRRSPSAEESFEATDARPTEAPGPAPATDLGLEALRRRIVTLATIASDHGACMSVVELSSLLPASAFRTHNSLDRFLQDDAVLKGELTFESGKVTLRGKEDLLRLGSRQSALTEDLVRSTREFTYQLRRSCPWIRLSAISGSTSFGGPNQGDDVDLFLVVDRNRVWITMALALLKARIARRRGAPAYCINRVLDLNRCGDDFGNPNDPLVAREALTLFVLSGQAYYRSLLRGADWMSTYFPLRYRERTHALVEDAEGPIECTGRVHSFLNGLAFSLLAPYLVAVGLVRNRRLARQGRVGAQFRTVIRRGFCAYESTKYDQLRNTYRSSIQ